MLLFLKETLDYDADSSELINLGKDIQQIENIQECRARAKHISECEKLEYPSRLGKMGRLGVSTAGNIIDRTQYDSLIYKIHLALNESDLNNRCWKYKTPDSRTSDNYVLYTKHPEFNNIILVLGIISPSAHQRISGDKKLIDKIFQEVSFFQNLDEAEIRECLKYKILE